jgi:acyl homoserine lactone synthase
MAYDEFDTPGALYFIWRDDNEVARGVIRLLPTTLPYIIQKHYPHMVTNGPLPAHPDIWEMTGVCIDRDVHPFQRKRICPEMLAGVHEYCLRTGISDVVGIACHHLIHHSFGQAVTWMGPPEMVDGKVEGAFSVPAEHIRPVARCEHLGIPAMVLDERGLEPTAVAA